jgi:hypothetical protein
VLAVVLSAVSKPNYMLAVVPALALLAAVRALRRRTLDWWLVAAIGATGLGAVLLMQRFYGDAGVQVVWAPLAAVRTLAPVDITLALKLLASIAFPAAAVFAWPRLVAHDIPLAVAWTALGVALAQGYLLAEAGLRIDHGNLLAGGSMAAFVLLVATARAVLAHDTSQTPVRTWLVWGVLMLQVVGGWRHALVVLAPERWATPFTLVAVGVAVLWMAAMSSGEAHEPRRTATAAQ